MALQHQRSEVVVIGAGVIGCAIAYYAAKSGLQVQVIERGTIGGQASGVAGGLIAPSGQIKESGAYSDFVIPSLKMFPSLSEELKEVSGIDIGLDCNGSLRLAFTEDEAIQLQASIPLLHELGFEIDWLTPSEALTLDAAITPSCSGVAYCHNEGQVKAQRLVAAYAEGARRQGATFTKGNATKILFKDNTAIGVDMRGQASIIAEHTIIASGTWSSLFSKQLQLDIPVRPMKGQIATVRHMKAAPDHIIFAGDLYVAQKHDGSTIIGATKEDVGYDQSTTIAGLLDLLMVARQFTPGLDAATLSSLKAGLRPRTPDKLPIIGPISGYNNLSIATGHNSNGILMSALTGQIIVAQLTGTSSPVDPKPYCSERFTQRPEG